MIKVFFADGGTLEQLHTTLERIADASDARLADLEGKIDENATCRSPIACP
jgi:hypothetical protein